MRGLCPRSGEKSIVTVLNGWWGEWAPFPTPPPTTIETAFSLGLYGRGEGKAKKVRLWERQEYNKYYHVCLIQLSQLLFNSSCLLRSECFCLQSSCVEILISKGNDISRRGLGGQCLNQEEDRILLGGISAFTKRPRKFSCPSYHVSAQRGAAAREPGWGPSSDQGEADSLVSDYPGPRAVGNRFLLFINHPFHGVVS